MTLSPMEGELISRRSYFKLYAVIIGVIITAYMINWYFLQANNPELLTPGLTIYNIDNYWYDSQFRNLIEFGVFTINPEYHELSVRRTPVYPLFYGIPVYYLGKEIGGFLVMLLQVFLHLTASYMIGRILAMGGASINRQKTGILMYGVCPFIFFYCFYTLTESVTPFLVVMTVFALLKYRAAESVNAQRRWLVLLGVILGVAILTRPLLGLIVPSIGLFLFFERKVSPLRRLWNIFVVGGFLFLTILPWAIRNYRVTNELILTEKWYYEDPMDFGRSHNYLRKWVNSFMNPANFSVENLGYEIRHSSDYASIEKAINKYLSGIPQYVKEYYGDERINAAFRSYGDCVHSRELQMKNSGIGLKDLAERPCEYETKEMFNSMLNDAKRNNPVKYYFLVPGTILVRSGIVHSFSSHWLFLKFVYRPVAIVIKSIFFVFNVALWAALIGFAIRKRRENEIPLKRVVLITTLLTVIFHIFYFRYFEARYFLPLYPLFIMAFCICLPGGLASVVFSKKNFLFKNA